ncbi:12677_t:CDS:2 [Cetraspora pellucida]|uniref:12677_t:CDS:1 n=1 Tax=Cetraspora pellucida TaxID=1433469 RepID=A0A9N9I0H1_9GLOM|nr:12677_t:CDS:2 [Cetraspora pellucida]
MNKELSTNKNNIDSNNVIDIDNDIKNEIIKSPSRSPLNEILENPSADVDVQNTSIMEKQETLETTLTQLTKDVRILQSSYENLKPKAKENGHEW